jgi:predicted nucleic acid-binding protein
MIYLDSSIMVARYLEEPDSPKAEEIWAREDEFVANGLTVAESVVALRRSALQSKVRDDGVALRTALARLDDDFLRVSISYDLGEPVALIRREPALADCRASDAIHVATALWLLTQGRPINFASLDMRQRKVAAAQGLSLLPMDS